MIRVVGGSYRGLKLRTLPGFATRPLLNQVREAIGNILQFQFQDAEVWDLFAGTGANGIEAISRGARRVVFVEKAGSACRVIQDNLRALPPEAGSRAVMVRGDAWEPPPIDGPGGPGAPETPPDIVFVDPPYALVEEDPVRCVHRVGAILRRTAPGGVVVFHFPDGVLDEDDFSELGHVDLREWGTSGVALIRRHAPADTGPAAPPGVPGQEPLPEAPPLHGAG
jgi:16S rRNA (guanine(966)-N(2))-methyltransferase RsmD